VYIQFIILPNLLDRSALKKDAPTVTYIVKMLYMFKFENQFHLQWKIKCCTILIAIYNILKKIEYSHLQFSHGNSGMNYIVYEVNSDINFPPQVLNKL